MRGRKRERERDGVVLPEPLFLRRRPYFSPLLLLQTTFMHLDSEPNNNYRGPTWLSKGLISGSVLRISGMQTATIQSNTSMMITAVKSATIKCRFNKYRHKLYNKKQYKKSVSMCTATIVKQKQLP